MVEKELRKMSRSELLELLLNQAETNKLLQKELDELNEKLKQREIAIENAGSIAEASLQLNDVFAAAESAAQQYIENIKLQYSQQEETYNSIIEEAQRKADSIIAEAEERARNICSKNNTSTTISEKKQEDSIERSADKIKNTATKNAAKNKSNNNSGKHGKKGSGKSRGKNRKKGKRRKK